MTKKSRGGTIVATGSDAEVERDRIMQILHAKIYALKSDPAWVKSPTEATLVGAYEELVKEIESLTKKGE